MKRPMKLMMMMIVVFVYVRRRQVFWRVVVVVVLKMMMPPRRSKALLDRKRLFVGLKDNRVRTTHPCFGNCRQAGI